MAAQDWAIQKEGTVWSLEVQKSELLTTKYQGGSQSLAATRLGDLKGRDSVAPIRTYNKSELLIPHNITKAGDLRQRPVYMMEEQAQCRRQRVLE